MTVALIYKKSAWELFSDSNDTNVSSFIVEEESQRDLLQESDLIQKNTITSVENILLANEIAYKKIYRSSLNQYNLTTFDLIITVVG